MPGCKAADCVWREEEKELRGCAGSREGRRPCHLPRTLAGASLAGSRRGGCTRASCRQRSSCIRGRAVHATQPKITSLAVLPLKNLSGDPAQEYLADGMTEALIGRLSMIHDLRVISRTSVMRFKDTQLSVPEIAKMLHVDAIVEGSVIREGSRVRVHAQLIRGATDEHFWSETYDREMRDALALESEVAQSIARRVEVTVTGEEHERLTQSRSVSPEVYESYLKGVFARGEGKADIEESIGYFEDAIRRDPTFAPAYVGLANAYRLSAPFSGAVHPNETRAKVISAARKALELDPELAEAHNFWQGWNGHSGSGPRPKRNTGGPWS